jgi:hypothetical protein
MVAQAQTAHREYRGGARRLGQRPRWQPVVGVDSDADWHDRQAGSFRVQCFIRVYEKEDLQRWVCTEIRSVQSGPPADH